MQTQILRRVCDSPKCDNSFDATVGNYGVEFNPNQERELPNWIVLTKEHILVSGQPPQAMTKVACSSRCAIEVINNGVLELPKLPAIPTKVPAAN